MSNIDYIKNVQLSGMINDVDTDNKLMFNTIGIPAANFPDVCIIKQFNLSSVVGETLYNVCLFTDLINDYVASGALKDGSLSVTPNSTIHFKEAPIGNKYFEIRELFNGQWIPITNDVNVTINLEFIRYKR